MDFKSIKKKALELKDKATEKLNDVAEFWAKKIAEGAIDTKEKLDKFIQNSEKTLFTDKNTKQTKIFKHKIIIIFWEENSDFFKDALINFPILSTKAFSSGIKLKLAKSNIKGVKLEDYRIKKLPCMVVFQDKKVYKIIEWEKNIEKITKSININLEQQIEKF